MAALEEVKNVIGLYPTDIVVCILTFLQPGYKCLFGDSQAGDVNGGPWLLRLIENSRFKLIAILSWHKLDGIFSIIDGSGREKTVGTCIKERYSLNFA